MARPAIEHLQGRAGADGRASLETREDGATPVAYNRVAGVVVVGNEDGAHHVIAETNGALNDIGYSMPGQNWTY